MQRTPVTVLKADISGSTPLGEKLDPEELRGVLGAYFAALAREVEAHGGRVDKYIGDAVMAVFGLPQPRPDDPARAIRAGLGMQAAIEAQNEDLIARYGVRLSLRIGVHTAELVTADDAEPTLMGDAVTTAERMEASAPLNTVLVSATTRAAAARRFRFVRSPDVELKGGGRIAAFRPLSARKRTAERGGRIARNSASASLQVGGQKQYVLQEERKIVTILFADVSVVEGRPAPMEHREVLGAYFSDAAREIERFGGTIDKYIGDAVMAVFGAPISHDDDGARAIAAALAIQRSIRRRNVDLERERGVRLAARIGVNTGEVVAGLLPGEVVAYTITGDAVNTAQRIESVAPVGEVLVSESTRTLARGAFTYEAVLPLTLKGKTEPVPAYRVLGAEAGGTPVEGPPLVGRSDQLAWLHERFALAAAGLGQVAHLHGEAGVGKTRIVAEFLSTLPETTKRLRARANSYESATPYAVVADLLRRAFAIAPSDDEPTADAALTHGLEPYEPSERDAARALFLEILGYGARSALGPAQKRQLLRSLIHDLIARNSEPSGVVVIEDVHWIDAASSELLAAVITDLRDLRCLILTTSREPSVAWDAESLPMQPLGAEFAAEMVDRVAGHLLDPAVRALVLQRTGGNPFFIEEVVRSIRTGGAATVPATVQDVLEARLDRLDEAPRAVAQRAAIIGRTFSVPLLERVLPRTDLRSAIDALVAEGLVMPGEAAPEPTYTFAHALVQEVAYRTQLIAQRRRAHVGVGDAVVALYAGRLDEFVDVLAYQYGRGDDDPKARTALLRAGRRAQQLYAKQEALAYFAQAVERSADDRSARAEADEAMGDVERVTGSYEAALARYTEAMAERGSEAVAVQRLTRKGAIVQQVRGDLARAAQIFREVLAALPRDAHEERARTLLNIGEVSWRQGRYDDATSHLEGAIVEAGSDEAVAAEALKQLGTVASHKGQPDRARDYFQRSLTAYDHVGDVLGQANVFNNLGVLERTRSDHDAALAAYTSALTIRERIGDQVGRVHSLNNIGQIHYLLGDLSKAVESFAAALEIARSIGYALGIGATLEALGASRVELGEHEQGLRDLRDGVAEIERSGSLPNLVDALCDLANAYASSEAPEAISTAERAVEIARELRLAERIGIALQALGRARWSRRDRIGAIAALEESRIVLEPVDDPQELARTLALLGRIYAEDASRRAEGVAMLKRARETFTRLGAALDLRRMEQSLAM